MSVLLDNAKRLDTARARVALWGGTLSVIEGDDGRPLLIVSRWALCKSFADLEEVERFLARVGTPERDDARPSRGLEKP